MLGLSGTHAALNQRSCKTDFFDQVDWKILWPRGDVVVMARNLGLGAGL
jgi:hypothetical protein